jgi:hypothetical protein
MGKKSEYIVDMQSGEVIWISRSVKSILLAYCMLGYDVKRKFYFFSHYRRKEILEIINYESQMVD